MKFEIYKEAVKRTIKDLGPENNLSHMALGFASELSELEECLSNDDYDKINLAEELGDKMWYAANWSNFLNYNFKHEELFEEGNYSFIGTAYSDLIIYGGKLADIAKRFLAYLQSPGNQEIQRREKAVTKKELHKFQTNEQICFNYITAIHSMCLAHGLDIEIVMAANIAKLAKRYPENFTNDDAITRSLNDERAVLESFYKGE
jgi:NTP pyrophosphatase (non-canonical NTP hydrolase)